MTTFLSWYQKTPQGFESAPPITRMYWPTAMAVHAPHSEDMDDKAVHLLVSISYTSAVLVPLPPSMQVLSPITAIAKLRRGEAIDDTVLHFLVVGLDSSALEKIASPEAPPTTKI